MQDQTSKEQDSGQTSMFGPPPIINGENASDYNELLLRASSALTPRDFVEEILANDFVYLTWEIWRWRRLKTALGATLNNIEHAERVDRLITIAEGRRNAVLREIDRRRAVLAQMLQTRAQEIEATEFETFTQKAVPSISEANP